MSLKKDTKSITLNYSDTGRTITVTCPNYYLFGNRVYATRGEMIQNNQNSLIDHLKNVKKFDLTGKPVQYGLVGRYNTTQYFSNYRWDGENKMTGEPRRRNTPPLKTFIEPEGTTWSTTDGL